MTFSAHKSIPPLDIHQAARFAVLALAGITREYPNAPGLVLNAAADAQTPRRLHPAFYGCFDWHSSVHGHWMLARLLHMFPDLPQAAEIRLAIETNLSAANLQMEADYIKAPNHASFERTYGWAWLLKLAQELASWHDPAVAAWSCHLQPLVEIIVNGYLDFLPRQTYPIRVGTHANTAFGLTFALDYALACQHSNLEKLIVQRALVYYAGDRDYPASWEPGGNDFLSPALVEADLMWRVMSQAEFTRWFHAFLPQLPGTLLTPVTVSDRGDLQLVHLDGLNLSRAWCMHNIATHLPEEHPFREALLTSAGLHTRAGLDHVVSGHYGGEHWLASFAVYLLTSR